MLEGRNADVGLQHRELVHLCPGRRVRGDGFHALNGRISGVGTRLRAVDRKSTRLNSSHLVISYAVFCLKKKKLNSAAPPLEALLPPLHPHSSHPLVVRPPCMTSVPPPPTPLHLCRLDLIPMVVASPDVG